MNRFSELARLCVAAGMSRKDARETFERELLKAFLEDTGNVSRAALHLGIHRNTVMRQCKRLQVERKCRPGRPKR